MLANLRKLDLKQIEEIADVTDGIHSSIDYDDNSKINLISATSPRENFFDLSRNAHISAIAHKQNPRTALRENDVIISTVGTIGNCAVVDASVLPANSDRHVGIIRISNGYSPYMLSTFLLSKYGRMQTSRETTGNVQPNLFIYKLKQLLVPFFSDDFQSSVERQVKSAHKKLADAKRLYADAERLLLDSLGLLGWEPKNEAVSIRRFSDFTASGRLDAEYYQPKYDEIEAKIKSYKDGYMTIGECFEQNRDLNGFQKDAYNYIEIGDVDTGIGSVSYNMVESENLPDNAKIVLKKGDLLVSKVRPYRGAVAIIDFDEDDLIASGAFTVLREKSLYRKEVLQVLLRTSMYKMWLLKWNVGTSYPVIKDDDILNLPIPKIDTGTQNKIAENIRASFALRAESRALLDEAKRRVEEAIEHGEK